MNSPKRTAYGRRRAQAIRDKAFEWFEVKGVTSKGVATPAPVSVCELPTLTEAIEAYIAEHSPEASR